MNKTAFQNKIYRRTDQTFTLHGLLTPILFAHRGGASEAPESTPRAFRYAIEEAKADVLELDVQFTKEGEIVVWHGPDLENVYIEGVETDPKKRPKGRRNIGDFYWEELKGKAWVADPGESDLNTVLDNQEGRQLVRLSELLELFPRTPLNIEMKASFYDKNGNGNGLRDNVSKFLDIVTKGKNERNIVVASARHRTLKEFRRQDSKNYPTNFSWFEHLTLPFVKKISKNRVFETTHVKYVSSRRIIEKVRKLGGSTYVFLTHLWPFPAIDIDPLEKDIFEILDRGVDGIMTDRPGCIRKIMDKWIQMTEEDQ